METHLTGSFRVRATHAGFADVRKLFPRKKDRMEIRRHALKLRYWPVRHPQDEGGQVLDLDWTWVKGQPPGTNIGELRIHDVIGGFNNLRIMFFVGDAAVRQPVPMIWVLYVFQKKSQDLSKAAIAIARARRKIIVERFYAG